MTSNTDTTAQTIGVEIGKILGRKIEDGSNFFAEGVDSLAALELSVALEEELGVNCFLEDIFEAPTVSQLAQRLIERG